MLLEIGLFLALVFFLFYWWMTKDFNYFDGQGEVKVSTPTFPWGCSGVKKMFMGKIPFTDIQLDILKEYPNEKIVGYFMFNSPRYIINDWELAKQVLVKDFEYFTDRPAFRDSDPINNQFLTNLGGEEWKRMRMLMSGVFTSGKLKLMLPHIAKCGENFASYIDKMSQDGKEIDMKDTAGLLTLDAIATGGFGIQVNSFEDQKNTFRLQALALVGTPGYSKQSVFMVMLKTLIINAWPKLGIDILKFRILDGEAVTFFAKVIREAYKQRQATKQRRNDLIDLLIDEMNKSKSDAATANGEANQFESEFEADAAMNTDDVKDKKFEDEEIVLISNAMLFFFAGFDTTSLGIGMTCHKLCIYPDVQEKVYEEIMDVFGNEGKITFDKLGELKYMDKVISESLRFTTIVPQLERICTKNYKIPGTNVVIPKDRVVNVYMQGFTDSNDNFYNAKEFDPDNFNPDNNPNKFAFAAFGQGPRNCVGMRYALMVVKVGLVNLLRNHKIVRGEKMLEELRLTPEMNHFVNGIPAKIVRRED